jgi:hypothetical protein
VGNFGPPQIVKEKTSQKEVILKLFKAIIIQMVQKGKTTEQIKKFTRKPLPESLDLKPDPYSSRDCLFSQINIHTSLNERVEILLELENSGQI